MEVFRRMAAGKSIDEQSLDWPQPYASGLDGDSSDYGEFEDDD